MSNKIPGSVLLSIAATFAVSVGAISVLAEVQDPTGQNPAPEKQTTTSKRRTTTKKSKQTPTNAEATGDQTPPSQSTVPPASGEQTPAPVVAAQTSPTQQTDLSGTYTGVFNCDALGLTGDTTLTITGNQFTTADGKSGRIVASTTRGYTAVALQIGDSATTPSTTTAATTTPTAAPTIVSLRGRKSGNRLTLSPVSAAQPCSFATGSKMASKRTRRSTQEPAATGAEVASPAEAGPAPADMTKPATPTRKNSRRSTTRTTAPAETPPVTVTPAETMPKQDPSPVPPSPTPTPSPSPSPSGSPSSSPSPTPSPEASPNPSPSPSPSPAPKRPRN
jgi:hypothetical protein